jgi:hypothetical protein
MKDLINSWDGDCKLVYGRPRHPQSQGLVEQANGTLQRMLISAMEQQKRKDWANLLPRIVFTMNTSISSSIKAEVEEEEVEGEFEEEEEEEEEEPAVTSKDPNSSIIRKRQRVNNNKEKNAAKMINKHDHKRNKKTIVFQVGDSVSIKIPEIDQITHKRLPGIIISISNQQQPYHEIQTEWGILNIKYRTADLEPYSGIVNIKEGNKNLISLTQAATLQSKSVGLIEAVVKSCNCSKYCLGDKRCSCFSNGVKCGSHCHKKQAGKQKNCKNCETKSKKK